MINYVNEFKFYESSVPKELIISDVDGTFTITNSELYVEEFQLTETLTDGSTIGFGQVNASEITFRTTNTTAELKGKTVTVTMIIDGDTDNPFVIGTYKIDSAILSADKTCRDVTAYDAIYELNNLDVTDWYNGLTFPMTLKSFRDSFFSYVGIAQTDVTLINDSISLEKTVEAQTLYGNDIICAICELNAVFGRINRSGNFTYYAVNGSPVKEISTSMYTSFSVEDYTVKTIDGVCIRQISDDVGYKYGTCDNPLIIEGNFLVYDKSETDMQTIATNILNSVSATQYSFTPSHLECIGNPCMEVGDSYSVTTLDGSVYNSIILTRTLTGIQALYDTYESPCDEERSETVNPVETQIKQLMGKYNSISVTVDGISEEIYDADKGLKHNLEVTTSGLSSEISRATNAEDTLNTLITTSVGNITLEIDSMQKQIDGAIDTYTSEEIPTLTNYPAMDWTTALLVYPESDPKVQYLPEDGTTGIALVCSATDYDNHIRSIDYCTSDDSTYRFRRIDETSWGWLEVTDTEFGVAMARISQLEVSEESITQEVAETKTYLAKDSSGNYTTAVSKEQLESSVSTSATSILSTVSKNYYAITDDRNEILSSEFKTTVEQNADYIKNTAMAKTGGTETTFAWKLNSDKFELFSNSSTVFTCNSSGVTVKGNVTATSGYIGSGSSGFTIGNTSIYNNKSSRDDSTTSGIYLGTDGIALGANFTVTNTGVLTAKSATLTGSVTATSGYIGSADSGFTIKSSYIANGKTALSDANDGVYVGASGIALGASDVFKVTKTGALTATSATISGKITSTSGSIGGFTIGSSSITNTKTTLTDSSDGVYVGTDGIALGASSAFKVTKAGALTATNATVSGSITATSGTFGCFKISGNIIASNDKDGFGTERAFFVNADKTSSNYGVSILKGSLGVIDFGESALHYGITAVDGNWGSTGKFYLGGDGIAIGHCFSGNSDGVIKIGYSSTYPATINMANATITSNIHRTSGTSVYIEDGSSSYKSYTLLTGSTVGIVLNRKQYIRTGDYDVQISTGSSDSSAYILYDASASKLTVNPSTLIVGKSSGTIGFFGTSAKSKQSVSKATSTTLLTQFNALLTALNSYGLISAS